MPSPDSNQIAIYLITAFLRSGSHLFLFEALLFLQHFPLPVLGFADRLHALLPLALLVEVPALHDALHDGAGVDVLELVSGDLLEDTHLLRRRVRVVREGHERRWPVVHGVRGTPWRAREVRFDGREWRSEYDGVNIL